MWNIASIYANIKSKFYVFRYIHRRHKVSYVSVFEQIREICVVYSCLKYN